MIYRFSYKSITFLYISVFLLVADIFSLGFEFEFELKLTVEFIEN